MYINVTCIYVYFYYFKKNGKHDLNYELRMNELSIYIFHTFIFRRWGFMVPWIIVYAVNILGYFAGAIIMFYQLAGPWKALGIVPLTVGCFLLVGHFSVLFFCIEQRSDYLSGACNNLVDGSGASSPS